VHEEFAGESISWSSAETGRVYVGSAGGGGLLRSEDSGSFWVALECGSDTVYAVEADPRRPGRVYASIGDRLVRSDDSGLTWSDITAPSVLPGAVITDIDVHVVDGREALYLSTTGLYRAAEVGGGWGRLGIVAGSLTSRSLPVHEVYLHADRVYASRVGRGLFMTLDTVARPTVPSLSAAAAAVGQNIVVTGGDSTTTLVTLCELAALAVDDSDGSRTLALPDGAHVLTAYAVDFAGNVSAESTPVVVTIDTTPPETTLTVAPPDGRFGWYRTAPSVSLAATDAVTGVASTAYSWDATSPMAPFGDALIAPEGEHTLYAASVDATGNAEAPRAFGFHVDTTAPDLLLVPPMGASALTGPVVVTGGVSDANPFGWSLQVGRGSEPASWVTLASAEGSASGSPTALFDASHYAKGDYTLRLLATDEAGNTGEARTPVTVATLTTARYYDRAFENDYVRLELDGFGVVTALRCDLDGSGSPADDASLLRGASEGASGVGVILDGDAARAQRALAAGGTVTITPYATSTQAGQRVVVDLPAEGLRVTEDWSLTPASEYALCDLRVEVTGETTVRDVSLGVWMRADADEDAPADDLSLLGLAYGDGLAPGTITTGTTEAGSLWAALGSEESSLAVGIAAEDPSSLAVRSLPESWPYDRALTARVVNDGTALPQGLDETRRFALLGGRSLDDVGEAASAFASPPRVASLSSSVVAPGTEVALSGTGFGASRGASRVTFAGVDAEVLSWTDTAVTVLVPEGVTGGYAGVWRTGVCSNGVYFVTGTPPRLDALSTEAALPGSEVTLTGVDFGTVTGTVTFAGVAADIVSWSDTSVTAVVPAGAPAGYVGAWRDGICSNGRFFTPSARPSIADVDPMFAPAGSSVTVEGTGFGAAPGQVTLAGVTCDVLSWDETAVVFRVPEGAASGYVGVWSNGVCSNGVWFGVTE